MLKYEIEIKEIMKDGFTLTEPLSDINSDTNLQNIGFNSVSFIQLVVAIEKKFDIEFPDDSINFESMFNIRRLCDVLNSIIKE